MKIKYLLGYVFKKFYNKEINTVVRHCESNATVVLRLRLLDHYTIIIPVNTADDRMKNKEKNDTKWIRGLCLYIYYSTLIYFIHFFFVYFFVYFFLFIFCLCCNTFFIF